MMIFISSCSIKIAKDGIPMQVAVKFALGSGQIVLPRSSSERHLREFLPEALQDVHFSSAELLLLRTLDGQLQHALLQSAPT
jgi:diketogulonate reductase-like aldo/keto reductase